MAVLEAILLGVRVVTLPMGPLLALFARDRLVDFVPIHDHGLGTRLQSYHNETREPYLLQEEFQRHVADYLVSLDQEVDPYPYPTIPLTPYTTPTLT